MITGHLGVAAAARSGWKNASLIWLMAGSVAPDVLDLTYAALRVCNPQGRYSHTLPVVVPLALLVGGVAFLATRSRATGLATALMVLLHLPPDLITGYKEYWPGGPMLGLDLYRRPLLDVLLEAAVVTTGWLLLRRAGSGPRWATSGYSLAGLLLLQALAGASVFGTKPNACGDLQLGRAVSLRSSSSR